MAAVRHEVLGKTVQDRGQFVRFWSMTHRFKSEGEAYSALLSGPISFNNMQVMLSLVNHQNEQLLLAHLVSHTTRHVHIEISNITFYEQTFDWN